MERRTASHLAGAGCLLVVGSGLLAATAVDATPAAVDATTAAVDPVLAAYALFVVGFLAGAGVQHRGGNDREAAGHLVAVLGWVAAAGGHATGDVRLAALSLATLGASGLALLSLGVGGVRTSEREGEPDPR